MNPASLPLSRLAIAAHGDRVLRILRKAIGAPPLLQRPEYADPERQPWGIRKAATWRPAPGSKRASLRLFVAVAVLATGCASPIPQEEVAVPTAMPHPPSAVPTEPPTITLVAVGDVMLARDLVTLMDTHGSTYPFEHVATLLGDADVTIANIEGTLTERGTPADKKYTFRTPPRHAAGLAQAGIDVVSLGNNHALDFGPEGLQDTIAALDAVGIAHSGAGQGEEAARRPAILEVKGTRMAFLSYAATADAVSAGPGQSGIAWGSVETMRDDIRQAKEEADVVVVSLHAGVEYADEPSPDQRALAQAAAEAGAALVLGHHPHVLQPWEFHDSTLIVYSLGNFVFDLDEDDLTELGPAPFQTVVLRLELAADGVKHVEPIPVFIDPLENRPRRATPAEATAILDRVGLLGGQAGQP